MADHETEAGKNALLFVEYYRKLGPEFAKCERVAARWLALIQNPSSTQENYLALRGELDDGVDRGSGWVDLLIQVSAWGRRRFRDS